MRRVLLCVLSANDNTIAGADLCACTAACAFVRQDTGIAVLHDDSFVLAFALAAATADTGIHTYGTGYTGDVAVTAAYDHALACGQQFDNIARAGSDAGTAGRTFLFVDDSQMVHHLDGAE